MSFNAEATIILVPNFSANPLPQYTFIPVPKLLSFCSAPDPEPATALKRQAKQSFQREFTVLKHIPAS